MGQNKNLLTTDAKNHELLRGAELGILLDEAYSRAIAVDARVSDIQIVPVPEDSNRVAFATPSWESPSGKHQVHIRLGGLAPILDRYTAKVDSTPGARKLFAQMLGVPPSDLTPQLLYVQSFLHEFGHPLEYMRYELRPNDLLARQQREKAAMPVGVVSISTLVAMTPSERQNMETQLHTTAQRPGIHTFDQLVQAQHEAYRNMTSERRADEFAADVLARNPALLHSLINPNIDAYRQV